MLLVGVPALFSNSSTHWYRLEGTVWLGSLFFAQILILIGLSIFALCFSKNKQQGQLMWRVLLVASVAIVLFTFYMQHFGPRVVTEADGPSSVHYQCLYNGLIPYKFPGDPLCTLWFMPTAMGNATVILSDEAVRWNGSDVERVSILALDTLLLLNVSAALLLEKRR